MLHGDQQHVEWPTIRRLVLFNASLALVVTFAAVVYQALLLSLSLSLFFAYLFAPLVDWMTLRHPERRPYACLLLIVTLLSILTVLVASLLPQIYSQALEIAKVFPAAVQFFIDRFEPLKKLLLGTGLFATETIDAAWQDLNLVTQLTGQGKVFVEKLWESTPSFFGHVVNFALVPVLLFFLLNDLPRLRRGVQLAVPPDLRLPMDEFRKKIDLTLKSVMKGQLMVAFVLAVLYMFGLSAVNLESGLAIGAIAGICRIVPYLDVVVGMFLGLVVIITQNSGFGQLIAVCGVFLVVQILDGMIITPRIIGEKAGLHPGVVIASVIAFGDWFGFVGILIAVPVVAVIKVFLQASFPYWRLSSFYRTFSPYPASVELEAAEKTPTSVE